MPAVKIDPEKFYWVHLSKKVQLDNITIIPRQGRKICLKGSILTRIKDDVDSYEVR